MIFLGGLLIGFGTAFILGPVFFTLLKNAHNHGVKGGIYTALGILMSDVIAVSICYYFASSLLDEYLDKAWLKIAAAAVLLFLGYKFIKNPVLLKMDENSSGTYDYLKAFYQGFLVNFINPAVFVIWITYIGIGKSTYTTTHDVWIYLIGILSGIFITDILKSYGSEILLRKINSRNMHLIFRTLGIILIGIAIRLVYTAMVQII